MMHLKSKSFAKELAGVSHVHNVDYVVFVNYLANCLLCYNYKLYYKYNVVWRK